MFVTFNMFDIWLSTRGADFQGQLSLIPRHPFRVQSTENLGNLQYNGVRWGFLVNTSKNYKKKKVQF